MRILLYISRNRQLVPFNYHEGITSFLHRCLGYNDIHDSISLYSYSWLNKGVLVKNGLDFPYGTSMFISFYNDSYMLKLIRGIQKMPNLEWGMSVESIQIVDEPDFEARKSFMCGSPIFIKRVIDKASRNYKYFIYNDLVSQDYMKETLVRKMRAAGMDVDPSLDIRFDVNSTSKRIKLIKYKNNTCKASYCPILIEGKPETKRFAWHVGIGNCTGIGFGAIY